MSKHQGKKCVICNEPGKEGYFTIPSDEKTKAAWLERCPEGTVADGKRVCFRHFDIDKEIKVGGARYSLTRGE